MFINIFVLFTIIKRWIEKKRNPYFKPIFDDCEDYKIAYKKIDLDNENQNLESTEPLAINE